MTVEKSTIQRFQERKIILPTFAQLEDPTTIPINIIKELKVKKLNYEKVIFSISISNN